MSKKIIHLMHNSQFAQGFITFVNQNFNNKEHLFIVINGGKMVNIEEFYAQTDNVLRINFVGHNTKNKLIKSILYLLQLPFLLLTVIPRLLFAKKIIIHSLFIPFLQIIFLPCFFLLRKTYWFIWGGDLYAYLTPPTTTKAKISAHGKRFIIKRLFAVITHVKGDYFYAKEWYGFTGKYYSSFMYMSNLYKEADVQKVEQTNIITVQIGNSATPSNYHVKVFDILKVLYLTNVKLMVPLSYGDDAYRKSVIEIGQTFFKDQFIPMTTFMSLEKYTQFQSTIDIAIFNHNRQQGVGNIVTLLGMGKKVYLSSDVTTYQMLIDLGLTLFDIKEGINLDKIDPNLAKKNIEIIKNYFSPKQLKADMEKIWND